MTVEPLRDREPAVGDVVLVRFRGHEYLHLVKARQGSRFLIGNNLGGMNGWLTRRQIFGLATHVEHGRAELPRLNTGTQVLAHGGRGYPFAWISSLTW